MLRTRSMTDEAFDTIEPQLIGQTLDHIKQSLPIETQRTLIKANVILAIGHTSNTILGAAREFDSKLLMNTVDQRFPQEDHPDEYPWHEKIFRNPDTWTAEEKRKVDEFFKEILSR